MNHQLIAALAVGLLVIGGCYLRFGRRESVALVPIAGDGDCLFHCFQRALRSLGKDISIRQLRAAVSERMDTEKLRFLKEIFESAREAGDKRLLADYAWLHDVQTLEDLRARMLTSEYYGDEMALPVLEEVTGIDATVINRDGLEQVRLDKQATGNRYKMILRLDQTHYSIVSIDGQLVFPRKKRLARKKLIQ